MVAINQNASSTEKYAGNRRVRKTVTNGGLAGNIPNGTTDSCWFGWQTMEERNPSGGTDTAIKQYVWGLESASGYSGNRVLPKGWRMQGGATSNIEGKIWRGARTRQTAALRRNPKGRASPPTMASSFRLGVSPCQDTPRCHFLPRDRIGSVAAPIYRETDSPVDECIQINLLQPAGPQQLAAGVYYPLQDTLYRAVALTNSSGAVVEAYDTDAYGNTLIFTGPGADNTWFTDDDTQSSYGANNIIYCGYRYDAETGNYYVRNRYYSPALSRWLTRDPLGYVNGANAYQFVGSSPVGMVDGHGTDFIALADHYIVGTPFFHHYSIEYWKSCRNPPIGKVEYYSQFIAGHENTRKKMQAVELEPYAYLNNGLWGPPVVLVSFIVFTDAPHKFEDLFAGTPAQVAAKWKYVVVNANAYKYAEHGSPPEWGASFEFWPNSLYQLPPGGNNSNTFAEATVKAAGIPWRGLPGSHPGNNAPKPVHTWIDKFDLARGW